MAEFSILTAPSDDPLAFIAGAGRAATLIRARDWSDHPLGAPADWPGALKTALSLVLNSPESMILCWGDDLHFFLNDTYIPLLGPRVEWATGAPFREVWHDAWEQAQPIVADALAGRSERFSDLPWQLETDRGAAETWFTFSYSRVLDETGAVAGLFVLTTETTERVLGERALVESQQRLADALAELQTANASLSGDVKTRTAERDLLWESSPDLLVMMDLAATALRVNPAWTTVLGREPADVVGQNLLDLLHPDDLTETLAALATATDGPLPSFENRYRHRDGTYRWISWVAAPAHGLIYATGRHITADKNAQDALRHAEDQLRQAQKVEAVGQLTGGVAHDFNNLLTVIRGSVDLLRRPGLSDERRTRYVDAIADTAERATKLTGQLLAFARRQALRPEVFDVCDSIGALRDMMQTLAGSRIMIDIIRPDCPAYVNADRSQFDTAVVNIAVNARDAMGGAGTLTVRVEMRSSMPAVRGHHAVTGAFVAVILSDTGTGIASDQLDRIFEPFYTTKDVGHGTGLGLSQVFGFAKQSGGEVDVRSAVGSGTTFTLYLPVVEAPTIPQPGATSVAAPVAPDACVLLVEDNAKVAAFAVDALEELGYRTIRAGDGASALRTLATRHAEIDIVFSDVVMPGMSGIELAHAMRARFAQVPIVLTSGYSDVLARGGSDGFVLLHKPYSIDQLARTLAQMMERRAPR